MSNIFFSADTHLGHSRIIQYCNRPFVDHLEMEEVMIERFNSKLRAGDLLYLLGDISWSSYNWMDFLSRLNTKEVHIVLGNHDEEESKVRKKYGKAIRSACNLRTVKFGATRIALCHYAMRSWPGRGAGAFHLFGHSHGKLPGEGRSMDVGVDTNNFYPYELEEVKMLLQDKPIFDFQFQEKAG